MKRTLSLLGKFRDEDSTEKFVYKTANGIIEITIIKNKMDKNILVFCLPTHHFCNLGCKFCHLTQAKLTKKRMRPVSYIDLVNAINASSEENISPNILLSFMGVGEPFLNKELITKTFYAYKNINGCTSLALATMMPEIDIIDFFIEQVSANDLPLKIHFSLHSPIDKIRNDIIPASKTKVESCFEALTRYRISAEQKTKIMDNLSVFHNYNNSVEIHYTIIENVNDSDEELSKLIAYGQKYRIPLKLIKFNPTNTLKRSKKEISWIKILTAEYGPKVLFYEPPGPNIGSSCGQFTKHYYLVDNSEEEIKEFNKWKIKYQVFD